MLYVTNLQGPIRSHEDHGLPLIARRPWPLSWCVIWAWRGQPMQTRSPVSTGRPWLAGQRRWTEVLSTANRRGNVRTYWKIKSDLTHKNSKFSSRLMVKRYIIKNALSVSVMFIVQELCESRGGRPGLSVLTSLLVSVDVRLYWTMLRHWSQLVPNMSTDIWGH